MAIYYFTILLLTGGGFLFTTMPYAKVLKLSVQKSMTVYLAAVFCILTLLTSLRYAIGFDYFSYRTIYEMSADASFHDIYQYYGFEPLFFAVCKLSTLIGLPFQAFLTVINIFLLFTALWFVSRYSKLPWMSIYLYLTLQFLAYDMNLIRQAIAVSFFLLAYPYLKDRKIIPFSILLFIGGLFHNSLWFIYPLYFLLPIKISRRFAAILSALAAFGYLLFDTLFPLIQPFLPTKYAIYEQTYFWNSNAWEYILLPTIYCILIYLFRNRIDDPVKRSIFLNSAFYHFLISLFITKHFILERFAIYPFVFSLIAIPEIISSYHTENNHKKRICVTLLFLLFGGAYFLFAAAKGYHNVYPYISLFEKSRSTPL